MSVAIPGSTGRPIASTVPSLEILQVKTPDPATTAVVSANGISKRFKVYSKPWDRLTEWLTYNRAVRHTDFWALRDISFELKRGESLGIIGVNGSGKSTLLKILTGAMRPTIGSFRVKGRVLSLIELGTGLNFELTGRQNVFNCSEMLNFPSSFAQDKIEDIAAFAELGEFFDRPVRVYSSGMLVRLAFSMWACFEPEILIVDEALSVGDIFFQQKCFKRIHEMIDSGVTMLFVSHDVTAIETLCDRVLVLNHGNAAYYGDVRTGVRKYYSIASKSTEVSQNLKLDSKLAQPEVGNSGENTLGVDIINSLIWHSPATTNAIGDSSINIEGICFRQENGEPGECIEQSSWLNIFVHFRALARVESVNAGVALVDRTNRVVFAVGWINQNIAPVTLNAGENVVSCYRVKMDVEPGQYVINVGVANVLRDATNITGWSFNGGHRCCELPQAAIIAVIPRHDNIVKFYGVAGLDNSISRSVLERSE